MISIPQPKELATIRVAQGGVSLWIVAILLIVMGIPGGFVGHWFGERAGRKALLAEIAQKNKPVQDIIAKGDREAAVVEAEAIKELGGQIDELEKAEKRLEEASKPRPPRTVVRTEFVKEPEPDCPRVPARCVSQ